MVFNYNCLYRKYKSGIKCKSDKKLSFVSWTVGFRNLMIKLIIVIIIVQKALFYANITQKNHSNSLPIIFINLKKINKHKNKKWNDVKFKN